MKESLRIAMIGAESIPGGAMGIDAHVTELASRMVREGHFVTAYAKPRLFGREWLYNGVRVQATMPLFSRLYAVLHACIVLRAQVIHFHGADTAAFYAWLPHLLRPRTKVVTTFYTSPSSTRFMRGLRRRVAEKTAIEYSHELIATDKIVARDVLARHGAWLRYVPNGTHVRRVATNDIVLAGLGLRSANYVACFAESDEDIKTILAAWTDAHRRSARFAHYRLAVVGKAAKTDDRSVVFTGTQTGEVRNALFAGAAFVIVPEGANAYAALEAMSYGRAVVAPATRALAPAVDGLAGQYTPGDTELLATYIVEMLEDPMFAASVGHMARSFVEAEYSWDRAAAETLECYNGGYEEAVDAGAVQHLLQ